MVRSLKAQQISKENFLSAGTLSCYLGTKVASTLKMTLQSVGYYGRLHCQSYIGKSVRSLPEEVFELLGYVNGVLKGLNFYEISVEVDKYGMILVRASMSEPEEHEIVLGYFTSRKENESCYLYNVSNRLIRSFTTASSKVTLVSISSIGELHTGTRDEKKYIGYALKRNAGRDFNSSEEIAVCILI